ncbi:MAG: cytochrome P450 [Acidimicrobiales bacterium]
MMSHTAMFVPRSGDGWVDPHPMYEALRDHDPLHHVDDPTGRDHDHWVLSRFEDVWRAARDHGTFSSEQGLTTTYGERERIGLDEARPMVMMDPPDHTAFRRLVARGFTPRQVATVEPAIRAFVTDRLDAVAEAGACDIVAALFKPLPSMVVAHYLGVPDADRERFDVWTEAIVDANALGDVTLAATRLSELLDYFSELIERRRAAPGDDMISELVAAGDDVSVLAVLGFAFTMVAGGNDTTTGLLGGAAELLTAHPDQRRLLLDDPGLLPGAVEELLRLTSPVQGLARTTTTPVTLHGRTVPAGRKVLLLYGSANRDPREFGDEADRLDVTRRIERMMTFGYGVHHCLGAAAARLQARIALELLLERFPAFEVDADAGTFAPGNYVRRRTSLPFRPVGSDA